MKILVKINGKIKEIGRYDENGGDPNAKDRILLKHRKEGKIPLDALINYILIE